MVNETENISIMGNDPARAIRSMSIPLVFAFLLSSVQLYIDSFWCSGLGPDPNSAITLAGPLFWILVDVGAGLGVGASTAISRSLGAKNYDRVNGLASQAMVLIIMVSVALSLLIFLCSTPLISFMSGNRNVDLSMEYLTPFLIFSPFIMLNGIILGMLRSEGEAKRSSKLSILASVINIILDPILIYSLDMGLTGASIATCISYIATTMIGLTWYIKGKMFIKPSFSHFRFNKEQLWDICRVGIPHSLELAVIPLLMMPQNSLVVQIGGTDGMITYSLPYRYISLAMVPAQAIAAAMIPVASYSIGNRDREGVLFCFSYSTKLILIISIILTLILLVFSEPFSYAFTYSEDMAQFRSEIAMVIRIYALVLTAICIIHLSSSILQTLCRSQLATITMFVRELIFLGLFYISTFFSMTAIYWSLDIAEIAGMVLMVLCVVYSIRTSLSKERGITITGGA